MDELQETVIDIDDQSESSMETDYASPTGRIAEIEVDLTADFMKKRLAKVPGKPFEPRSVTIFHLPGWFHETKMELCEPKMVAIGPYHHGKDGLRTMEEHKWYTLRDFLARNENVGLEVYLQAMKSIELEARHCYSETVDMGSDEFVMMLLLDGCFILECFLKHVSHEYDAFLEVGLAMLDLLSDMCLLENQVPFFVIHKLLAIQEQEVGWSPNCEHHCPLLKLISDFLRHGGCFAQFTPPKKSCNDIHHLLHLYYTGIVPDQTQTQSEKRNIGSDISHNFCGLDCSRSSNLFSKSSKADSESSEPNVGPWIMEQMNIQCVSELHAAGIKFKRKKKPRHMLDVSFENGTIEMPFLPVDSTRIKVLWNMVAFEQSRTRWDFPQTLSSYLTLMDSLIDTKKDIAILERFGIIESYFQNAEETALFFNQFGKIVVLNYGGHYFHDFFKDVQKYSELTWHKYRARLMRDYFSNPWSSISVVAAGILLILTFLQTYYSAAN